MLLPATDASVRDTHEMYSHLIRDGADQWVVNMEQQLLFNKGVCTHIVLLGTFNIVYNFLIS